MRSVNKKIITSLLILLFIVVGIIIVSFPNNFSKDIIKNNAIENPGKDMLSIMLETTPGTYEQKSDSVWPEGEYDLNEEKSKCENGGTISFNTSTRKITLKTNISDKCYAYFDKVVDLIIPTTYNGTQGVPENIGANAALSCSGASATYNNQYNRIEVSAINAPKAKCNLTYTSKSASEKYYYNDLFTYTGTYGNGQLVHETFESGDYTSATPLTQAEYGTTTQYSATSASATTGTAVNNIFTYSGNEWNAAAANLTSNTYYHLTFTIPTIGYYQFCYEMSSGSATNAIYYYQGTTAKESDTAITTGTKSVCVDMGKLAANTSSRIVIRPYTSIATFKFSLKKGTAKTVDTGYRFEGANPNNYIWFNNELWRIIGVFGSDSHGVANTNLVKIIRNTALDAIDFYKTSNNSWNASGLKTLLNSYYYNKQNATGNTNCYAYSTTNTGNCNYDVTGIDEKYRPMIKEVTWYLGGLHTTSGHMHYYATTASNYYKYERGSFVYSGRPTSGTGYIGLMYPSDYGFATLTSTNCPRTITILTSYGTDYCAGQNWIYGSSNEWFLTPASSSSTNNTYLTVSGNISNVAVTSGEAYRPVVYLDSSVYYVGGSGTITDPYLVGM